MRRRGPARPAAIHRLQHLARPRFRPGAAAHVDQRADDRADHIIEEPVGLDFQGDEVLALPPAPLDAQVIDRADARFSRRSGGLETAEIVRADQRRGGPLHGVGIQSPVGEMPGVAAGENVADRPVVDHVAVSLPHGIVRGVETVVYVGRLEHGHAVGQHRIEGPLKHFGRQPRLGAETDDLAQGMHAGVGPSAGQGRRPHAGNLLDRFFKGRLDGAAVLLRLPAGEIGAVIGQGELDGAHREMVGSRSPTRCAGTPSLVPPCFLPPTLHQQLGDLHGVGGGAFAKVVADAPEGQAVGRGEVFPDPSDERLVAVIGQRAAWDKSSSPDRPARPAPAWPRTAAGLRRR